VTRPSRVVPAVWLLGGTAYLLVRAGFGTYPGLPIALDITTQLPSIPHFPPLAQFLEFSPLGPAIAATLHLTGSTGYEALHVAVLVAGMTAAALVIHRRWPAPTTLLAVTAFLTSQTAVVALAWTGSYDVFTIVLGTAIVICRRPWVAALAGFVAAFAAFEQSIISVVALIAVTFLARAPGRDRYLAAAGGLVVGRIVLTIVLRANDVTHDRRYWWQHFGIGHFLDQFWRALPLLLLTGLGTSILIVAACLWLGVSTWRSRAVWLGALVVPLVAVALGEDQTRVYANIVWPIVLALVLVTAEAIPPPRAVALSRVSLVLGLLVPSIFLWRGDPHLADHHLWRFI
jgi:hypothetical protein